METKKFNKNYFGNVKKTLDELTRDILVALTLVQYSSNKNELYSAFSAIEDASGLALTILDGCDSDPESTQLYSADRSVYKNLLNCKEKGEHEDGE